MTAIAIGSACWVLDVYSRPRDAYGGIDHRAQWQRQYVIDETRMSWVIGRYKGVEHLIKKVAKNDPSKTRGPKDGNSTNRVLWSDDALERYLWEQEHRHRVHSLAQKQTGEDLEKLAAFLGYTPLPTRVPDVEGEPCPAK